MDDSTSINENSEEVEVSPKDNDDTEDAIQDRPPISGTNTTTFGNPVLTSVRQDASENQQLSYGISTETSSRPSVFTAASFSQVLPSDNLDKISSRDLTLKNPLEAAMDMKPPQIDVAPEMPATSSHQPLITDSSSADHRLNSLSDNDESGATMHPDTSACRLSIYLSNAQKLLLSVLQEIMVFDDEEDQYKVFLKLFRETSKSHCCITELCLNHKLLTYLFDKETAWKVKTLFTLRKKSLEYCTEMFYEILIERVVAALFITVTVRLSLNFDVIIKTYKTFKNLYERCSQFWRRTVEEHSEEKMQDESSRNRVEILKKKMQGLLLQTKTAFQFLLMHVGKNAEQSKKDKYVEELCEEDKKFLRLNCFKILR